MRYTVISCFKYERMDIMEYSHYIYSLMIINEYCWVITHFTSNNVIPEPIHSLSFNWSFKWLCWLALHATITYITLYELETPFSIHIRESSQFVCICFFFKSGPIFLMVKAQITQKKNIRVCNLSQKLPVAVVIVFVFFPKKNSNKWTSFHPKYGTIYLPSYL